MRLSIWVVSDSSAAEAFSIQTERLKRRAHFIVDVSCDNESVNVNKSIEILVLTFMTNDCLVINFASTSISLSDFPKVTNGIFCFHCTWGESINFPSSAALRKLWKFQNVETKHKQVQRDIFIGGKSLNCPWNNTDKDNTRTHVLFSPLQFTSLAKCFRHPISRTAKSHSRLRIIEAPYNEAPRIDNFAKIISCFLLLKFSYLRRMGRNWKQGEQSALCLNLRKMLESTLVGEKIYFSLMNYVKNSGWSS